MDTVFFFAFVSGLAGGFGHCIGMCGPLAAACALRMEGAGHAGSLRPQVL